MMNIETAAGRLLLVGFEQNRFDEELARLLAEIRPGGVIFFGRNIAGAAEFAELLSQIVEALAEHGTRGGPPLLAMDLEGGRVDQLREVLAPFPSPRAVAATNDDLFVRNFGALVGEALASFGLNVTLAPVLDLASPEAEPVLGTRTASADPQQVVRFGRNFLAGLARQGVVGCGKHFPGLGSAPGDTHIEMPRVEKPAERFWQEDLLPFRELHNELSLMMLSHASYPSLDPSLDPPLDPSLEAAGSAPRPASISRELVRGLLRERIGFRGVVIADDLGMSGVLGGRSIGEAAVAALEAGCDLLPVCRSAENIRTVHRALVERAGQEASFADRIQEAAGRIEALQQELQKTAGNKQQASTDWRRLAQAIRQLNEGAEDMGTLAAIMPRYSAVAARPQRGRRPPGGAGRAPRPGGARRERGDRRPGSSRPGPDRDRPRGPRGSHDRPRRPPGRRPPHEP